MNVNQLFKETISKCLEYDQNKRIDIKDLLKEKMFENVKNLKPSILMEKPRLKLIRRKTWTNNDQQDKSFDKSETSNNNVNGSSNNIYWHRPMMMHNTTSPFVNAFSKPITQNNLPITRSITLFFL